MSAGMRALLLIFPLVTFGIWGGLYLPAPGTGTNEQGADITLDALPPMPGWADIDLPDFSQYQNTAEKKNAFFSFLYPRIVLANSRILIERQYLQTLSRKEMLDESEINWLAQQAERLRVDEEPGSDEMFRQLNSRLDYIPPSLVMAQAANESAWGTSRFALVGNNLFGQWCFSKGCGVVPKGRAEGKTHEVATFDSPYGSILGYIQNLNRHPSYQLVRDVRQKARANGQFASGTAMAAGLLSYSERGEEYISEIRSMISFNKLLDYDREFRMNVLESGAGKLTQLASSKNETTLLPGQGEADSSANEG